MKKEKILSADHIFGEILYYPNVMLNNSYMKLRDNFPFDFSAATRHAVEYLNFSLKLVINKYVSEETRL